MTQQSLTEHSAKVRNDASETSRLAALRAAPRSGKARRRVLEAIVSAGERGMTDDEIAEHTGMSPNTARPRRLELVEGEWVQETTDRRPSFYGNPAIVWRATPRAVLLVEDHYGKT